MEMHFFYQDVLVASDNGLIDVKEDVWCLFGNDPAGNVQDRSGSLIVNPYGVGSLSGEKIKAKHVFIDGVAYVTAYTSETFGTTTTKNFYKTAESVSNAKFSWFYSTDMRPETTSPTYFNDSNLSFEEYEHQYKSGTVELAEFPLANQDGSDLDNLLFRKYMEVYMYDDYRTIPVDERSKN